MTTKNGFDNDNSRCPGIFWWNHPYLVTELCVLFGAILSCYCLWFSTKVIHLSWLNWKENIEKNISSIISVKHKHQKVLLKLDMNLYFPNISSRTKLAKEATTKASLLCNKNLYFRHHPQFYFFKHFVVFNFFYQKWLYYHFIDAKHHLRMTIHMVFLTFSSPFAC